MITGKEISYCIVNPKFSLEQQINMLKKKVLESGHRIKFIETLSD